MAAQDHPRVCGEKSTGQWHQISAVGSPPRVRGKEYLDNPDSHVVGITPACAGKSGVSYVSSAASGDHPRVCGEKMLTVPFSPELLGSPPRVRGKVLPMPWRVKASRITPACAGKRLKKS